MPAAIAITGLEIPKKPRPMAIVVRLSPNPKNYEGPINNREIVVRKMHVIIRNRFSTLSGMAITPTADKM